MGGTLYLNVGKPADRDTVCISGYDSAKANYALSNFYPGDDGNGFMMNDPDEGPLRFPTTEHYLHFQKLSPQGKKTYKDTYTDPSKSPKEILALGRTISGPDLRDELKASGKWAGKTADAAWDKLCVPIQMQINATKYQQSPAFRDSIHEAQRVGKAFGDGDPSAATIIEDTASLGGQRPEVKWGTGPDGAGRNVLGNSQTAFANMLAQGYRPPPPGTSPSLGEFSAPDGSASKPTQQLFNAAERQFKQGVQKSLLAARGGPSVTDTSDLGAGRVQVIQPGQPLPKGPSFKAGPPQQAATLPVAKDKSGKLLSVKPSAQFKVDFQFDKKGNFVRAFWHNGSKWDELKGKGLDKQWVKNAKKQAEEAVQQHIKPAPSTPVHAAPPQPVVQPIKPAPSTPVHAGPPQAAALVVGQDRSGKRLSVRVDKVLEKGEKLEIDCQFDRSGKFDRAFWKRGSKWEEVKGEGLDRRWVKAARQEAQQAVTLHLNPAEQASQTRSYSKTQKLFAKSPARVGRAPEPKSIPIPDVVGVNEKGINNSFSIQDVSAAYLDKGPKTEAVKLTFASEEALETAFEALDEMVPGLVRIDPASAGTGEKPALSFHGSVASFEKFASMLQARDKQQFGTGIQDVDEQSFEDDQSYKFEP